MRRSAARIASVVNESRLSRCAKRTTGKLTCDGNDVWRDRRRPIGRSRLNLQQQICVAGNTKTDAAK